MSQQQEYKYKFSIVIPVYNVENYLAETIESVLAQTMDFERSCELILVNDGSPDNSEEVCLRYQQQFPKNITYVKQENAGPGAARNNGIARAQGKYISLLDSDDKLSRDALAEAYKFLEKHYDEIDLVSIKWEFFEARTGTDHPLNYKFTSDRIIDLNKGFTSIQSSCATAFFKAEVLRKHPFDPAVGRYSEDPRLMGEILLDNPKFGIVCKPTYFYRKRLDGASSLDTTFFDKFWYLETPKRAWYDLFDYTRKHNRGKIPKFIQFMVMYDLQFRFRQTVQTVLDDKELANYKLLLSGLLPNIDDDVIISMRNIDTDYKLFILDKKHGEPVLEHAQKRENKYYYKDTEIYNFRLATPAFHIEFIENKGGNLCIEGFYDGYLVNGAKLQFKLAGKTYEATRVDGRSQQQFFLGEVVSERPHFTCELAGGVGDIEVMVSDQTAPLPLETSRFSYLSASVKATYRVCGSWIIRKHNNKLTVRRYHWWRRLAYEIVYLGVLAKRLKLRIFLEQYVSWRQTKLPGLKFKPQNLKWLLVPAKSLARNLIIVTFRLTYFMVKPFCRRPIWLLSDRLMVADDSGEVLFHYLQRTQGVKANIYYVLSKNSSEFSRVKATGKVLKYFSFRHKLLFLLADKIVSSHADDYVINPFGGRIDDVIDLYNFDFVFLQHGIIKDDISNWLNRYNKNIKMFVASTKTERDSIINGNYGYDETVVKLTGLPRHDNLRSQPKNKIMVAPTWRENLAGSTDLKTGHKSSSRGFKSTDYYNFYQRLLNDVRLIAAMKKHNYTGEFFLHPAFGGYIKDFSGNETFRVMQMPYDYPKLKKEGNLLLTDYSSVAFDFAYLKKPILYAHFDEDTFYKTHIGKEGYFSYEKDGLGPVTYDYKGTVEQLIKFIQTQCEMSPKYQKRVDNYFAFHDRNNSKRVYEAILAMQ